MVEPVQNWEVDFVLHPVMKKNLSQFFKIGLFFPESFLEDDMLNRKKWAI
jgi:hypothetical protein